MDPRNKWDVPIFDLRVGTSCKENFKAQYQPNYGGSDGHRAHSVRILFQVFFFVL
jgi:hypothetical protein